MCSSVIRMSLQRAMVLMNGREYGRAISILEEEASNGNRTPSEQAEFCEWVAECHRKLEDHKMSGDWYLEAVKRILSQKIELGLRAKQALPFSEKALESYKTGGDAIDVLEAGKLRQRLLELSR